MLKASSLEIRQDRNFFKDLIETTGTLLEYLQIKLELGTEIFGTEYEIEFYDGFELEDLV